MYSEKKTNLRNHIQVHRAKRMTPQGCAVEKEEAVIQADLLNMTEERRSPLALVGMGSQASNPLGKSRDLISTGSTLSNSFLIYCLPRTTSPYSGPVCHITPVLPDGLLVSREDLAVVKWHQLPKSPVRYCVL